MKENLFHYNQKEDKHNGCGCMYALKFGMGY